MRSKDERAAAREKRQADRAQQREERERRRAERVEEFRRKQDETKARTAATTWLPALGVCVYGGQVYQHGGIESGTNSDLIATMDRRRGQGSKQLGPLAGARAEVVGGRLGHRRSANARFADTVAATSVLGPAGLLAAGSRKGTQGIALVGFADGTYHEKKINDAASLVRAEADAVRFNALVMGADGSVTPADGAVLAGTSQLSDELQRLAALRESGALTDVEFQAAKGRLLGL